MRQQGKHTTTQYNTTSVVLKTRIKGNKINVDTLNDQKPFNLVDWYQENVLKQP